MRGKQVVNQISLIFIFAFIGIYGDIQWYQKGNDASLLLWEWHCLERLTPSY
ncbi:hypothetical protein P7H20_20115 [Paenibacillus larvae]|nr:hypothetical protein [Paenibacillus larvae]MDT2264149.1 hypothetical protein [Paenibacillus larvae]MDT2276664.1 hypothetical protein [Paenibacillus larvae]